LRGRGRCVERPELSNRVVVLHTGREGEGRERPGEKERGAVGADESGSVQKNEEPNAV